MTYLEIDGTLVEITRTLCANCKKRLDAIPKEQAMERKAVQMEHGMYTFCGNAGLLFNTGWERTKVLDTRLHFWSRELYRYPEIREQYESLDGDEKLRFFAALQGELFLRDQWLGEQKAALKAARSANDIGQLFELNIKIGAVKNMFSAWEAWRLDNNIYPNIFKED